MTLNQFCQLIRGTLIVAALASCSGDDGGGVMIDAAPDAPAGCTSSDAKTTIADNGVHSPHVLLVPSADVAAGIGKTYDMTGTAAHSHMVTVTAADFMMLQAGGTIMVTSTMAGGHTHVVTISCA